MTNLGDVGDWFRTATGVATPVPWVPPLMEMDRPRMEESASTGQGWAAPKGVMVPRSYPVACFASAASGIDSRETPSRVRSFGQENSRSPGTRTKT